MIRRALCQSFRTYLRPGTFACLILLSGMMLPTVAQGQNAEVLRQLTTIEVSKGKLLKKHLWAIQINNRAGEEFTQVSIPWSGLIRVDNIEARITDLTGNEIKKLDRKSISERSDISSFSLYEDSYVKTFTLRHNRYPYILTYSYEELETQFIRIDTWVPVISPEIPTHEATLEIIVPDDFEIAFRSHAGDPVITTIPKKGIRYQWHSSHTRLLATREVLSPPVIYSLPHVEVVPINFFFEKAGSLESWVTFGNWQADMTGPPEVLPVPEKKRIDDLIRGIDDSRNKLLVLYHYLQDNTRYINVSIETGGLKPHPVSYVVNNRYGDCKALSNYFRSVLDYAGIRSLYSKIYAGEGFIETDRSFPSQSFNHIILCVPIEDDTMWVDCTSDYPAGYTGTSIQGRDVFVVEKDDSHFRRIPPLTPDDVEEIRVYEVSSLSSTSASVKIRMTLKGYKYELLRYAATTMAENDRRQIIADKLLPPGLIMNDFSIDPVHRDSSYINLEISAESNRIFELYGENLVISAPPFSLPALEEPNVRITPLRMEYPIKQCDSLIYNLPSGYKIISLPADTVLESPSGRFSFSARVNGERVSVKRSVTINAGTYAGDQYAEVYEFLRRIKDAGRTTVIITAKQLNQ